MASKLFCVVVVEHYYQPWYVFAENEIEAKQKVAEQDEDAVIDDRGGECGEWEDDSTWDVEEVTQAYRIDHYKALRKQCEE